MLIYMLVKKPASSSSSPVPCTFPSSPPVFGGVETGDFEGEKVGSWEGEEVGKVGGVDGFGEGWKVGEVDGFWDGEKLGF